MARIAKNAPTFPEMEILSVFVIRIGNFRVIRTILPLKYAHLINFVYLVP
jgi:hypothetical protein